MTDHTGTRAVRSSWLLVSLSIAAIIHLLPSGLGSYWGSHMIANAYMPGLGLTENFALVDSTSVRAYVALDAALWTITGAEPRSVLNSLSLWSVTGLYGMYFLICRALASHKSCFLPMIATCVSLIVFGQVAFLTGYILGPALLLSLAILWILLQLKQASKPIPSLFGLLALCWLALGLMWHSLQVATLIIAFFFHLATHARQRQSQEQTYWRVFAFMVAIAAATWLYMRPDMLHGVFHTPFSHFSVVNLLQQGNYAGQFQYTSQLQMGWATTMRYAAYACAYALMAIMALRTIIHASSWTARDESSVPPLFLMAVLCADIAFQSMYFAVTGSMAPGILLFFGIPTLLMIILGEERNHFGWLRRVPIQIIALILIVSGLTATALQVQYRYQTEDVDQHCALSAYTHSHDWCATHLPSTTIYSDSATSGHYQVLSAISQRDDSSYLHSFSVDHGLYKNLANYQEHPPYISLAVNKIMWNRHLVFGSLQSWNRYEPIDLFAVGDAHKMALVYSDQAISTLVPATIRSGKSASYSPAPILQTRPE